MVIEIGDHSTAGGVVMGRVIRFGHTTIDEFCHLVKHRLTVTLALANLQVDLAIFVGKVV
jgi:hypothetical protein